MIKRALQRDGVEAEVVRFLLVGSTTVIVDFAVYSSALLLGGTVTMAKVLGFIVGTTFAFFANRAWTFKAHTSSASSTVPRFLLVYAVTLIINVAINHFALQFLMPWAEVLDSRQVIFVQGYKIVVTAAFIVATIVSAACNFVGMKLFVFRRLGVAPLVEMEINQSVEEIEEEQSNARERGFVY